MIYISTLQISRQQFNRLNRLLDEIDFNNSSQEMEDIIDELGATVDAWEVGFQFNFENGAIIFIDIRSGNHNYYDDVMWQKGDDEELLDCSYVLDEKNEYCIGEDVYICKFIFEEELNNEQI